MTAPDAAGALADPDELRRRVADLQGAVDASPDDPALRVGLAEALDQLATRRRRDASGGSALAGSIHSTVEVLTLRRRAADAWAEAVRVDAQSAPTHTARARALGRLASSLTAAGSDPGEVLEAERGAVEAYAEAFRIAPGDADARTARGALLSAIGVALQRRGDNAAALASYREAFDDLQAARGLAPARPAAVSESGWVLVRTGTVQAALGRPAEAVVALESAVAVFAEVRRLAPENSFGPLSQGQAYTVLGEIQAANPPPVRPGAPMQPPLDRPIGAYRQALACYDAALGLDPASVVVSAAKAEALQGLGELQALAARPGEALTAYREALKIYDGPLAGNTQSFQHQLGRGRCLMRIGELSRDLGDEAAAESSLQAALEELSREVPIDAAALRLRSELLRRLTGGSVEAEQPPPGPRPN